MEELKSLLLEMVENLDPPLSKAVMERLSNLVSVYPFNEFEFLISSLMGYGKITLDDYYELRDEYLARNLYLFIFEIGAPRGFGETWAQGHLKSICPELTKPTKKLDGNYSGQYDFLVADGIRVEVKASRAVDAGSTEPLYVKALSIDSKKNFNMNFQQIKPACCDVFVWVGVWRDQIRYWVLSSDEVKGHADFSGGQHRGNEGEGQLWLTQKNIDNFNVFESSTRDLLVHIQEAAGRQRSSNQ